ncbi:hypothetical protein C8J55DRAFT_561156 [Lentinula edodes]|uniref:F-box domain-containing protein n=1 Tax=Lentinula lateritia TaxID=40482 RepID=A0A9W9ACG9_9AGAR|nr:hypothetical protein C8J55DRAFT_561156 [Lentinula edodes]
MATLETHNGTSIENYLRRMVNLKTWIVNCNLHQHFYAGATVDDFLPSHPFHCAAIGTTTCYVLAGGESGEVVFDIASGLYDCLQISQHGASSLLIILKSKCSNSSNTYGEWFMHSKLDKVFQTCRLDCKEGQLQHPLTYIHRELPGWIDHLNPKNVQVNGPGLRASSSDILCVEVDQNTKKLPLELIDDILSYLKLGDICGLSRTSKYHLHIAHRAFHQCIRIVLRNFVINPDDFIRTMDDTHSCITGAAVLKLAEINQLSHFLLVIAAPKNGIRRWSEYALNQKWILRNNGDPEFTDNYCVSASEWETAKMERIRILISRAESYVPVILGFSTMASFPAPHSIS